MAYPGMFVVVEGCDATGKTTLVNKLEKLFSDSGMNIVSTREPGGTGLGEDIRHLLLDSKNRSMSMKCEALLYSAARAQLVEEVIRPALMRGDVVLCQRYLYSSLAYQGAAGGLGDFIGVLNEWATDALYPDLVILLDMDPTQSLLRKSTEKDRIESRNTEYHTAVRQAFLDMATSDPDRFVVVDASMEPDCVFSHVESAVLDFVRKHDPTKLQV